MSAQTEASSTRNRLITGPLARVLAASFGTLSSFYLLLSVIPVLATSSGSDGAAGIVTGLLMLGGVLAELAAPRLIATLGARWVLVLGLVLLGVPALLLLISHQLAVVGVICLVRGLGFGLAVVCTGSLVVSLLPRDRRGEGLGVSGLVASVPGIIALPAGLWIVTHAGYALVLVLAAVSAMAGLTARPCFFGPAHGADEPAPPTGKHMGMLDGLRSGAQRRPALAFTTTTIAGGILVAFLPLAGVSSGASAAALLVQAVTATIGRWAAGRYGDRHGHPRLLVPGLVTSSAGMMLLALASNPVSLVCGTLLFGAGFGTTQCITLTMMLDRVGPSGYGMVNAAWNFAYDAGYGAGPVAFGVVVGHTGYPAAFMLTGLLVMIGLVPAVRDRARTAISPIGAVACRALRDLSTSTVMPRAQPASERIRSAEPAVHLTEPASSWRSRRSNFACRREQRRMPASAD